MDDIDTTLDDNDTSEKAKQLIWDLLEGISEEEFADFLVALDTVVVTLKGGVQASVVR